MTQAEQYADIVGMRMRHPYVGVVRSGERIEITFLKLPIPTITLSCENYKGVLSWRVFDCLLEIHGRSTPEEQEKFKKFLDCSDGQYGTYSMMTPGMLEFGFIQLLPESEEVDVEVTRG